MKKNHVFIELILTLLFLCIGCSLILQAFVKADLLSKKAQSISKMQYEMQNTLEKWQADPTSKDAFSGWNESHGIYTKTLDKNNPKLKALVFESPKKDGVLYEIRIEGDGFSVSDFKYIKDTN